MTDAADPSATLSDPVRRALLEAPLAREREAGSMQRQLHERLKRAILDGRLAPGTRLPGSRALAEALAVSRNTVTATYEHLAAEGYLRPDRQG
ncbi:GntR family transcriptional regulator, partial [Variovorax sp.]|uniref:GntR family transcriptional regulator n=3 Tax=unclassified Variovorax TaxID=663243 RepID=UPI0040384E8D